MALSDAEVRRGALVERERYLEDAAIPCVKSQLQRFQYELRKIRRELKGDPE